MPALCLASYGLVCALQQPSHWDKFTDSLLCLPLIFFPFCLVELFSLFHIEFFGVQMLTSVIFKNLCGYGNTKALEKLDLLKFLPNSDPTSKDRILSLKAAKLLGATCPQLCFQAVLLLGYTPSEDVKLSQIFSIIASCFMIILISSDIVMFKKSDKPQQKDNPKQETCCCGLLPSQKRMKKLLKKAASAALVTLKQFLSVLPLLATSLLFHTGTLVLTVIVLEW